MGGVLSFLRYRAVTWYKSFNDAHQTATAITHAAGDTKAACDSPRAAVRACCARCRAAAVRQQPTPAARWGRRCLSRVFVRWFGHRGESWWRMQLRIPRCMRVLLSRGCTSVSVGLARTVPDAKRTRTRTDARRKGDSRSMQSSGGRALRTNPWREPAGRSE